MNRLLGEKQTQAPLAIYGGARLYIPRCEAALRELRNCRFREDVRAMVEQQGVSQKVAVQCLIGQYGITERWAYEILNRTPGDQLSLI